jgi:hypothetical protein
MPEQLPSPEVSLMGVVKIFKKNLYFTLGIILHQFEFHVELGLFVPVRINHLFMVYLVVFSVAQSTQDGQ